ncbi:MAG: DUF177 domain-containing protein [Chthoniobacteraceae bacterium]
MKIHTSQIPPEGAHFEGEESAAFLALSADITALTPVSYSLDVGLSEGGFFATGRVAVDLEVACVGCLERFTLPIRVDDFACQIELTSSEEINLTDTLREDILLALPPHPRCDWSGKRKCPGVERPPSAGLEPAEDRPDVWGALDKLKIK